MTLFHQQINDGQIDGAEPSLHLQLSRAHRSRLRTRWLQRRAKFSAQVSGGGHWADWPSEASQFLKAFVPLQKSLNFQLAGDELALRFGLDRHRQSVAAFVQTHFPDLLCQPKSGPKARCRWERARLSELWQHDSSIHQWWPPSPAPPEIILSIFAGLTLLQHGLLQVVYTDGLSLFGHDSMADDRDPCSEFQRAFSALEVAHQNYTICRTTGHSPNAAWDRALVE